MRAFIEGKPIPEKNEGNVVEILSPEERIVGLKSTEVSTETGSSLKQKAGTASFWNTIQHKASIQKGSLDHAAAKMSSNSISNDLAAESSSSKSISHPLPAGQSPSISGASNKRTGKPDPKFKFKSVYKSGPVPLNEDTQYSWIYPRHKDYPIRQYQLEISETAVLYNTLVSLPTGLGKTLIAAVVLYNYYRWFPEGKVIFLAPTLPLVSQQAEACYKIMGIPGIDTAVLTGRIKPWTRFDLWRSRRMFYCTPQTVQKDLLSDEGASFASKVCCVVLDEAHKASGDYAYTKVIEQLELAGAQFRIVGLSATPGTSIKAIQKVVDSLRAVKIEARQESDPSVAPYIHQKHSEIVIVPKNESQKDTERRLTRMLEPVLQYLKVHGALKFGGANTSAFQIHKSCQEYFKRNGNPNGSLRSYFQTAYKLIELRNDSYQSLGCVKLKIQRLKQTPQRGALAKMIKSKDFDDLHQRVLEATGSTLDCKTCSGRIVESFNPKLQKLAELLNEHFSRAKAAEKSSRAIVFSQFRDSVSEIVEQLKEYHPLVRARHFVGQQGSKRPVGDVDTRLGGMKQSEQQQVIKWFRENVYNVLVCTCIGEEGLDIGEVDLIVNFDTLRSPIRMIQRTGRTGRKRDGRVVCLISEGQEERTYKASKQAEQTLMIALKRCGSFKMSLHKPMLPKEPSREFAEIKIVGSFRFSQVGHSATRRQAKVQIWNLSPAQEEERSQLLGKVTSTRDDWKTVRAVLLRGWCGSFRTAVRGQSTQVLFRLKGLGSVKTEMLSRRSLASGAESIFPCFPQHEVELKKTRMPSLNCVEEKVHENQEHTALNLQENQFGGSNTASTMIGEKRQVNIDPGAQVSDLLSETVRDTGSQRREGANQGRSNNDHDDGIPQPTFRLPTPPPSSCEEDTGMPAEGRTFCFRLPTQDSSSSEGEGPKVCLQPFTSVESREPGFGILDRVAKTSNSQVQVTHHREHNDQAELSENRNWNAQPGTLRHSESDDSDSPLISLKHRKEESETPLLCFKKKDMSDAPLISLKRKAEDRPLGTTPGRRVFETSPEVQKGGNNKQSSHEIGPASRDGDPSFGNGLIQATQSLGDTREHAVTSRPARAPSLDQSIGEPLSLDSSISGESPHGNVASCASPLRQDRTPRSIERSSRYGELTDTPDCDANVDPEDIKCAVCCSGASTNENPIVLCDGKCNQGFHKLCYSMEFDLVSAHPWFCTGCSRAKRPLPTKRIFKKAPVRNISTQDNQVVDKRIHAYGSDDGNGQRKKRRLERLKAHRLGTARFVLDEAEIEVSDDIEGDDAEKDMLEALEEEENMSKDGFINDSTQLTQHYSDDELGKTDPNASRDVDFHHRNLDALFDQENRFKTPVLNRRASVGLDVDLSETPSQEGLGNMHFIRSILHHHQQGGNAQEIEAYFRDLQAAERSPGESSSIVERSEH